MYVENPRRLITWLVLLVLILIGVWAVFLRGGSSTPSLSKTPSTAVVVPPPTLVAKVDAAETAQSRVLITQKEGGVSIIRYVDVAAKVSALTRNGKLLEVQEKGTIYEYSGSCYFREPTKTLPSVAPFISEYLPIGGSAISYTFPAAKQIDWQEKLVANPKFKAPHGIVFINPVSDLATSATEYPPLGAALKVSISYPKNGPVYSVPTKICKHAPVSLLPQVTHAKKK